MNNRVLIVIVNFTRYLIIFNTSPIEYLFAKICKLFHSKIPLLLKTFKRQLMRCKYNISLLEYFAIDDCTSARNFGQTRLRKVVNLLNNLRNIIVGSSITMNLAITYTRCALYNTRRNLYKSQSIYAIIVH